MVDSTTDTQAALDAQRMQFQQFQRDALQRAKDMAAGQNQRPTLEHYRLAAMEIGQEKNLSPEEWNVKSYANLSGHTLDGFELSDYRDARAPARSLVNQYDRDGDGAISDFYGNVSLADAKLKNCIVDPATSFNEEMGKATELSHVTFNNLHSEDVFRLGNGNKTHAEISDIRMHGTNGGTIIIDGAAINSMTIDGNKVARFEMQNGAAIRNLTANAGIVEINATPGARLEHAQFTSDLSMAGNMRGIVLSHVDFRGNVPADMSGATLSNVTFTEGGMDGLNLSGTTISGLQIRGADGIVCAISSLNQLPQGVNVAGASLTPTQPAAATAVNPLAAVLSDINLAKLGVAGGIEADFNNVHLGVLPAVEQTVAAAKPESSVDLRSYYTQMSNRG